ncbi:MAG: TetR/AcrR family transcriptional regulator [Desulfobacter sp.]|nr:MAG: TetR/AcrR family transcriptional regulator [Desulfobacter sp.]
MPPKFKFTKDQILNTALHLVRKKGWTALSTRTLASALGTSAKPIYSFFKSMDDLEEALVIETLNLMYCRMRQPVTGDPWIDHGIGYVMFARSDNHLFRGSNNEKNIRHFKHHGEGIWKKCTDSLAGYSGFAGLTPDEIYQVQLTRWLLCHGLAFQLSNPPPATWDDDTIIKVVKDGSIAILEGLKGQRT